MNSNASMHFGLHMSAQKDVHTFLPVPMVYESLPAEPLRWEYHVLSIDLRERELPDTTELDELGSAGWLLVGSVPGRAATSFDPFNELGSASRLRESAGQKVYFYFVRQKLA